MKVVLFGNSTWCLTNFRAGLISRLVSAGAKVTVVAPLDQSFDNQKLLKQINELGADFVPINLLARNKNPLREIRSILELGKILSSIKPDAILTYTIKCNIYTGLCRYFIPCTQIANIPGMGEVFARKDLVYRIVCFLYRLAFRNVATSLFQNQEDLNFCLEQGLVKKGTTLLIPGSGVDTNKFLPSYPFSPGSASAVSGRLKLLMFGRLLPQKGYRQFLETAEYFSKTCGDRVEFMILGIEDKNRVESKQLYQDIKTASKKGIVRLFSSVVDVRPVLEQADVVCLPSTYNEGIPRSLLEAMASGKAIITTDWKGCRETVVNGKNGFLIDPLDPLSLRKSISHLLTLSRREVTSLGEQSRKLVLERFNENKVIEIYINELLSIGLPIPRSEPENNTFEERLPQTANL